MDGGCDSGSDGVGIPGVALRYHVLVCLPGTVARVYRSLGVMLRGSIDCG